MQPTCSKRGFVSLCALAVLTCTGAAARAQAPAATDLRDRQRALDDRVRSFVDVDEQDLSRMDFAQKYFGVYLQQALDNAIGATLTPVDATMRAQLELPAEEGLVVANVVEDGPAARVGLEQADILLSLDDQPVGNADDLTKWLKAAGEKHVVVKLLRAGKPTIIRVKPEYRVTLAPVAVEKRDYYIGVPVELPDETLHLHLPGLPAGQGLVATEVLPDSPAAKAGLRPYDILLEFNGKPLVNIETLIAQIQAAEGKPAPVQLLHAGKPLTITITPELRNEPARPSSEKAALTLVRTLYDARVLAFNPQGELMSGRPLNMVARNVLDAAPAAGVDRLEKQMEALTAELKRLETLVAELKGLRQTVDELDKALKAGKPRR